MNKKEIIDPTIAFEQMEAHAVNIACLTSEYYKRLKLEGVPEDLAWKLTVDFHSIIWNIGNNK
jgi:hypothetical protein